MASLLSPPTATATALVLAISQDPNTQLVCFSSTPSSTSIPTSQRPFLCSLTNHFFNKRNSSSFKCKCYASFDPISSLSVDASLIDLHHSSFSKFPAFLQSGYAQLQTLAAEIPESHKWGLLAFAGFIWIYLTARPGVLIGAIDTYLLAPLQIVLDTLTGRRSFRRTDFLIGERLGEGSFGVVYSGVIVPRNLDAERLPNRGNYTNRRNALQADDPRFKEKVILKKVFRILLTIGL